MFIYKNFLFYYRSLSTTIIEEKISTFIMINESIFYILVDFFLACKSSLMAVAVLLFNDRKSIAESGFTLSSQRAVSAVVT